MRLIYAFMISSWMLANSAYADGLSLIVGFAAGGTSSTAARIISDPLARIIGKQVIVESRPGAGGFIAAQWVARQQPASGTLLFMSSTSSLRVPKSLELVPVALVSTYPYVIAKKASPPFELAEFFKDAQQDQLLRNVATAGVGSIPHLVAEKLFHKWNAKMVHVPYTGSAQAILNVEGGHVALAAVPRPDILPFLDKMHVLAETRNGFNTSGWLGIFAPLGTSAAEAVRLGELFRLALLESAVSLKRVGFEPVWGTPSELAQLYASDIEELSPELERLGIKF